MSEAESEVNINSIVDESLKDIQQVKDNEDAALPSIQSLVKQVSMAENTAETPKQAIDQAWNQGIEDKVIAEKVGEENDQLKDYEEIVVWNEI